MRGKGATLQKNQSFIRVFPALIVLGYMHHKKQIKHSNKHYKDFLEYRKNLSSFDKKLEAGALVHQIGSVDVERACTIVNSRISRRNRNYSIVSVITRVAAIFALPLLAFTIWSLFLQKKQVEIVENEITWQEIHSPVGLRSQVVLPDGSNLWLNAGSNIRYSIPFTRETREIELSGEAYLDVVKNGESPFVVKSENTAIEVLGTQFNVKSFPEDNHIEVALKEGRVKFRIYENGRQNKYIELKPNDYLKFDKISKSVSLDNRNIENYIAWHKNILILDETPMEEVAKLLEHWYGIKVVIGDNEINKYKFTTTFDNEPLFRVLELLELSSPQLSIKYNPGKMDKTTKKVSQSIVTITKK